VVTPLPVTVPLDSRPEDEAMRRATLRLIAAVGVLTMAGETRAEGELECIQKPTFWFVGQQTRIVIRTPPDCGKLQVTHPDAVELFDRWPHKPGDATQRFYFRARAPLASGLLTFASGARRLETPVQVLSWAQALERRTAHGMALPRVFPMDGADEPKSGVSFMKPEELARLRQVDPDQKAALEQQIAELPDEKSVFYELTETAVPRAVFVHHKGVSRGCPVCGPKIFIGRSPFYPWVFDFTNHPWKVQCPECERWFPDNDFGAGDMTSGKYADDGWGYVDEQGVSFCFVSYYNCWHYMRRYSPLVLDLAQLYARTGDRRAGRLAALVQFRIAEQYLNLALNVNQRKAYMRSAVWKGEIIPQGMPKMYNTWFYVEHNWECPKIPAYAEAFEKLWDYFDSEDPELLAFLHANHHPEIRTMADARNFIETGYFRVVAQGCLDQTLIGNHPQAQRAAMEAALLLNTPRAKEIVDWTFNGQGGMRYFMANEFFIDGSAFESPGYNRGHYINTQSVADVLNRIVELRPEEYRDAGYPLLSQDPKYKYMYQFNIKYGLIGRTWADVGDSGDVAPTQPRPPRPCSTLRRSDYVPAFAAYPDCAEFAKVLWQAERGEPISELRNEELRQRVRSIIGREGADLDLSSSFLDGYGHAILRSGRGQDRRALWVRWGECYGHRHDDLLTIGYEAKQRTWLPELGYPHSWTYRVPWEGNRLTHYGACITGEPKYDKRIGGGRLLLFADGGWARMACVDARSYKDVGVPEIYRMIPDRVMSRTVALVDLSPQDSYAISIFRLTGGKGHYVSFHGPRGQATDAGIELTAQDGGTLAGADIEYGGGQEWTKANPKLMAFPYLYDVRRGTSEGVWRLEWTLEDFPDLHLRMHAVGPDGARVALAKGKPPGGGRPYELQWAIRSTSAAAAPLSSQFVTVIEAYDDQPLITAVRQLDVTTERPTDQPPVALQVVCGDRTDTIIECRDPTVPAVAANGVALTGSFGVWSEVNGKMQSAFLVNGASLGRGAMGVKPDAPFYHGAIASADFARRRITVEPPPPRPQRFVGRHLRVTSEAGNECSHLIVGAHRNGAAVEFELEYDPRIGEGPVASVRDGILECGATLYFGRWLYYHGKTLSNEDGAALYKVSGVTGRRYVHIDRERHPGATKDALAAAFADTDGDGVPRLIIYDYGPGDAVTIPNSASVTKNGE